jgi:general secretion pathway protein M
MTPVVTDRERWTALGLLVGLLAVAYLVLVHPWWTLPLMETNARIEQLQERDARLRAQIAQAPIVSRQLQAAQQRLASQPGFLAENSAELATAGLVQRLEAVVQQASPGNRSCAIQNRSPVPDAGRERYPRVVVQVRLQCGAPELATVLHALEAGTPRLFVDNLTVLAQRFNFGPVESGTGQGTGLDVSFDLVGYLRPRPAAAPAPGGPGAPASPAPAGPDPAVPAPTGGPDAP